MAAVTSAISVGASTFSGNRNVSTSQKKVVQIPGKASARCDMSSGQEQSTVSSSIILKSIAIGTASTVLLLGSNEAAFANAFDDLEASSSVVKLYQQSRTQSPTAPAVSKALPTPTAPNVSLDLDLNVDPVLLAAGGVGIATLAGGAALLSSSKGSKTVLPEKTAALVAAAKSPVIVDVRSRGESLLGSPDLDAKVVSVPYTSAKQSKKEPGRSTFGNTAGTFGERVIKAVGPDASTLLFFDGDGELAALAAAEVVPLTKASVFVVVGGAPAWKAKELPWKAPLGKLPGISLPGVDLSKLSSELKNVDTKKLVEDIKAKAKDVDLSKLSSEIQNVDTKKLVEDIKAKAKEVDTKEIGPLAAAAGIVAGSVLLLTNADFIASVGITGAVLYFAYEKLLFKEERDKTISEVKNLIEKLSSKLSSSPADTDTTPEFKKETALVEKKTTEALTKEVPLAAAASEKDASSVTPPPTAS